MGGAEKKGIVGKEKWKKETSESHIHGGERGRRRRGKGNSLRKMGRKSVVDLIIVPYRNSFKYEIGL